VGDSETLGRKQIERPPVKPPNPPMLMLKSGWDVWEVLFLSCVVE
jgi:hypothetical protein